MDQPASHVPAAPGAAGTSHKQVPAWTLVSATLAPVILIAGFTISALLQPTDYSSISETVSALAGLGATDRWVMTSALSVVGACQLTTAIGLRPAFAPGRLMLAAGGVMIVGVALSPLPTVGSSTAHALFAGAQFLLLSAWPLAAWRRNPGTPWALRPAPSIAAAAVMLALVGWFFLVVRADQIGGLVERLAVVATATWPLIVVLAIRRNTAADQAHK